MALNLFDSKGVGIESQRFTWRDMVQKPISKLDDDAFTRVRIILMNSQELEALNFGRMAARFNADLRVPLAKVRRAEQHELSDKAGWETLVALAEDQGLDDLAAEFTVALEKEREHLGLVTTWFDEALGMSYGEVEIPADAAGSTAPQGGGTTPAA